MQDQTSLTSIMRNSLYATQRPIFGKSRLNLIKLTVYLSVILGLVSFKSSTCHAKESEWGDLGVSLFGPKASNYGSSAASNLRILVSPQRRMTKSYEFDYSNSSQPVTGQGESSYLIPSSNSQYLTQSVSQLSPSHQTHSTAYSALSASLASLKNRLSARGVTLSGSLAEANGSNLYPSSGSTYGSSLLVDSQQNGQPQSQSQSTYLSVSSQPDSSSVYSGASSQNNDNKTIVLAIPAKINFLTDGRGKQQHQLQSQSQQQPAQQIQTQQVTVLQPSNDQGQRSEYSPKQQTVGLINSQEGAVEHSAQIASNPEQEQQQQYVLVNSQPQSADTTHIGTSAGAQLQTTGPLYSSIYPNVQQGTYAMKYVPTYQSVAGAQQPTIHKVYSTIEQSSYDQEQPSSMRYASCLETCNSADPRWRKYTVSKYKYCCSRSSQYDAQFESPSAEKVGEASSKYSDDSYYGYLYRKSRARRSRKSRPSRHNRYSTSSTSNNESDDNSDNLTLDSSRQSRPYQESSYSKYYKNRQPLTATDVIEAPVDSQTVTGGKYTSKDRQYRRSRSRDFEVADGHQTHEPSDDEPQYRGSTGYGSGEYSVESGRYAGESRQVIPEEDDSRPSFDETPDSEPTKVSSDGSEYPVEQVGDIQPDEGETDAAGSYKYLNSRRRKLYGKNGGKRRQSKDSRYPKKSRKAVRYNKEHSSSQANGTDYESAQAADQYNQDSSNSTEEEQQYGPSAETIDTDKDPISYSNKYKHGLNDSTVASLSKTTMHLKEILSLLEKKAQLRSNDSSSSLASLPTTSTPSPITTTSSYGSSLFGSQYSNPSSLTSSLSSDFLASELGLKSPYASYASSMNSPTISLPPSYGSLAPADAFSSLSPYSSSHYGFNQVKAMPMMSSHHPKRRRVNKNVRYNNMMIQKPHSHLGSASSLLHAASKSALLNNPYYAALQYPYLYRSVSPSVTSHYPYRNIHKNPYTSLLNGPVSSKLAAAASGNTGALYTDESRYHNVANYDPIATVASSLRPSSTMRLRSKPFVLQPHVMPIYTRHTILTSPLDVKK